MRTKAPLTDLNELIRQLEEPLQSNAMALLNDINKTPEDNRACTFRFLANRLEQLPLVSSSDQNVLEQILASLA